MILAHVYFNAADMFFYLCYLLHDALKKNTGT